MASTELLRTVDPDAILVGSALGTRLSEAIDRKHQMELNSSLLSTAKRSALEEASRQKQHTVLNELIQKSGGCAVIDGGLATELERRGADINDPLWSAKCLLEEETSKVVRQVHLDYFRAGADIAISASYQATLQGFAARGFSKEQGEALLRRSVELTQEARDIFWHEYQSQSGQGEAHGSANGGLPPRQRPLVAASIGSYGAYLADGSEYSGDYGPSVTVETLMAFHRRRLQVLAHSGADLLAIETIPSLQEAQAIVRLLDEENLPIPAWIAFNSKDGSNVVRGDPFEDCVRAAASSNHVVAVGINCTPPRFIHHLVAVTRKVTEKPIVLYPNSGEMWDGEKKMWVESTGATDDDFVSYAPRWRDAGANLLGGCCRTTPNTIHAIRKALAEGSR